MLFSVEQAFVGKEEIRAPLKTPAWEARPSVTKHCRKPSHSRPKRKSLKIIQIQEAIAGEIKQPKTLI